MKSILEKLSLAAITAVRSFVKFPVETLLCAGMFVVLCICTLEPSLICEERAISMLIWFIPLIIAVFCVGRLRSGFGCHAGDSGDADIPSASAPNGAGASRPWAEWAYYASALLAVPVAVFARRIDFTWTHGVTYLVAVVLLFYAGRRADNGRYASNMLHTLRCALMNGFLLGVVYALVSAILLTVHLLWDVDLDDGYVVALEFVGIFLFPVITFKGISEDDGNAGSGRFLRVLVEYVFTPALIVYSLILYLYMLKIVFQWELPQGGVAWMVLCYAFFALWCSLLHGVVTGGRFDWFYNALAYITAPALVLLWVGTIWRVAEYGLTTARVYLLVLDVLVTLFIVMSAIKRLSGFQRMSVILAVAASLLTFIPGIRAEDIAAYSRGDEVCGTENVRQP